jgi:hypothetical protein
MTKKKSLYEILEVPQDAGYAEIRASNERLLQALEDRHSALSREDYTLQLRLLKVAYNTLSTPASRDAYDAHLSTRSEPTRPGSALLVTSPAPSMGGTAAAIRADALMMRAEAMTLRADALGLKADLLTGQLDGHGGALGRPAASRWYRGLKRALLTLGTLAALGMVFKVVFMLLLTRQPEESVGGRGASEEKVFLQEYYQTWGVRPASRAEAALMDAQRRKNEEAVREQRQADEAKKAAEAAERNFESEARKRGEQVSAEVQYAEEKARQAQLYEARQKEDEKQRIAEAERSRLEAERAKWRSVLQTPSGN